MIIIDNSKNKTIRMIKNNYHLGFIQGLEMMLEALALVEVEGPAQEGQVEADVGQQ